MKKFFTVAALLLVGSALVACGNDDSNANQHPHGQAGSGGSGGAGGSGGTGGSACATDGTGSVQVDVSGLPQGVDADILVGGAPVAATATLQQVAAGEVEVRAGDVTMDAPIVRPVFRPSITAETLCVEDGETSTVTIVYEQIPTSEHLWSALRNHSVHVAAFDAAQLTAAGDQAPAIEADATTAAGTGAPAALTFDRDGNLWAAYASGELHRYLAAEIAAGGDPLPDVVITGFGGGLPGPTALAFDMDGNLWVAVTVQDRVVRYSPDQIAESGAPEAAVSVGGAGSGMENPRGLAFDAAGNLWVATSDDVVLRYDAGRLAGSGNEPPDARLTPMEAAARLTGGSSLAFDAAGNLWVSFFQSNKVGRIDAADLAGSGTALVEPGVLIEIGVTALLDGLAFDESGALWVALGDQGLGRYAPASLTASGRKSPDALIAGASVPDLPDVAFFPAARDLPLFHAVP